MPAPTPDAEHEITAHVDYAEFYVSVRAGNDTPAHAALPGIGEAFDREGVSARAVGEHRKGSSTEVLPAQLDQALGVFVGATTGTSERRGRHPSVHRHREQHRVYLQSVQSRCSLLVVGAIARRRKTLQLTVRMSEDVLARVGRLTDHVSRKLGMPATRTDVLREALLRGLELLEDKSLARQNKSTR